MKINIRMLSVLSLTALILSGCGSDEQTSEPIPIEELLDSNDAKTEEALSSPNENVASPECRESMAATARETNYERSEQLIVDSLSICQTAHEWMEMLKEYPAAMGVTDESFISDDDLILVCLDNPETPVCEDAVVTARMP